MHDTTQYAREFFHTIFYIQIELSAILSRMFSNAKYLANKRCMTFNTAAKNKLPTLYNVYFPSG